MTTVNSKNVFNIAVKGSFDDCQRLVKSMFNDRSFRQSINMSGVNSINWARIVVQIVYYFYSHFQLSKKNKKSVFSVPTGNFGDIYAGYIAYKMGLPISKLIIATNENDLLHKFLMNGIYKPSKVRFSISPIILNKLTYNLKMKEEIPKLVPIDIKSPRSSTFKLFHSSLQKFRRVQGLYRNY